MKKNLFLVSIVVLSAGCAFAYPLDINPAFSPLQMIQQQNFQKMEIYDYKRFKDAEDNPIEERYDSPEQIRAEFEIKNLKQPAKIQLGHPKKDSDMELIQNNGQIHIKHVGD